MSRPSTARHISYDLRPAKQTERRIIVDILKMSGECGLRPINQYRYVGMGANRFYDFLLLHRYLGINDMISLEHDRNMFERALFNCPFYFIDVRCESVAAFIAKDIPQSPTVYWFDYDGGLGEEVSADIMSLAGKLRLGDFFFITVFAGVPRFLENQSDEGRLAWFQDTFGELSGEINIGDVERAKFSSALHKILISSFKYAFALRGEGKFVPLLQVQYSDSVPMLTVGGSFLGNSQATAYCEIVPSVMPFLSVTTSVLYKIKSLNLTEKERVLFDRAVTAPDSRREERDSLTKMGFEDTELSSYKDLFRYLPRYVEAIV